MRKQGREGMLDTNSWKGILESLYHYMYIHAHKYCGGYNWLCDEIPQEFQFFKCIAYNVAWTELFRCSD